MYLPAVAVGERPTFGMSGWWGEGVRRASGLVVVVVVVSSLASANGGIGVVEGVGRDIDVVAGVESSILRFLEGGRVVEAGLARFTMIWDVAVWSSFEPFLRFSGFGVDFGACGLGESFWSVFCSFFQLLERSLRSMVALLSRHCWCCFSGGSFVPQKSQVATSTANRQNRRPFILTATTCPKILS